MRRKIKRVKYAPCWALVDRKLGTIRMDAYEGTLAIFNTRQDARRMVHRSPGAKVARCYITRRPP
jgi:hypothetical protein